jgi:hypothetical protein
MHIKTLVTILVSCLSIISAGERITPVVSEYTIDTSLYETYRLNDGGDRYKFVNAIKSARIYSGPLVERNQGSYFTIFFKAYVRKNTTQIDLYSFNGKSGSINIPSLQDSNLVSVAFSQTFIDNDPEWEILANLRNFTTDELHFSLFDDDGTELISDGGSAYLGFDGYNTYTIAQKGDFNDLFTIKSWKFRTNINQSGGSLSKKSASTAAPVMMTYGMPDGRYRVTLAPSSGGTTQMQMFDLAGRCLFSKQIENITQPVSFIVPDNNVPQTPFITKVSNGSGVTVKKELLVK